MNYNLRSVHSQNSNKDCVSVCVRMNAQTEKKETFIILYTHAYQCL